MDNITIEVTDTGNEGPFGEEELWIGVTGPDPLPDWPTIKRLTEQRTGRADIPPKPFRYFPSWGEPGEPYSELWICRKVKVDA